MIESEKKIEKALSDEVKQKGGICLKLLPSLFNGLPDRLCLLPGGKCIFVEVKTTNEKPRKLQKVVHKKLETLGFKVYTIDKKIDIKKIFEEC